MSTHKGSTNTATDPGSRPGLPIAPSLGPAIEGNRTSAPRDLVDRRTVFLSLIAIGLGIAAAAIARVLMALIAWVTGVAFYGSLHGGPASPAHNHLGGWVLVIPAIGGIIVGLMARYGSAAIRGHGIPEAMEQVLTNESKIPPRVTFLKPLSAAIAIGTGGPFGAEGPIIATGGALGSLCGQLLKTTAAERKILLAAGAAAGMTATFGCPVAAVVLAIELLLFEFRPRSLIPVAAASASATAVRLSMLGPAPMFPMPAVAAPGLLAVLFYAGLGLLTGLIAVWITRLVFAVEDAFDRLPIHWMWWPALGGLVVGAIGFVQPHTLGVGYDNIDHLLSGSLLGRAALFLCVMKLGSWAVSLGSGTSGGTLAPLFTIGGGLGAVAGGISAAALPHAGIDVRIAALVGMAAIFAGASRAVLASVIFALETTLQPLGILPLLAGCAASYLVSCLMLKESIMTEKIARRGVRVPAEYVADYLDQVLVKTVAAKAVVTLRAGDTVVAVRAWIAASKPETEHQGYPVVDSEGRLVGVLTRRNLLDPNARPDATIETLITRRPVVVLETDSLREAADRMATEGVGRLPVVDARDSDKVIGIVTRSDILGSHLRRIGESTRAGRSIRFRQRARRATPPEAKAAV